jgi:hypothetical protein
VALGTAPATAETTTARALSGRESTGRTESVRFGRDAPFLLSCNRVACRVDRGSVSLYLASHFESGFSTVYVSSVQSGGMVGNFV